jgi:hypothetical protein
VLKILGNHSALPMKKKTREKGLPFSHDHHGQKAKECAAKVRFVGACAGWPHMPGAESSSNLAPRRPHPQGHALRLLPQRRSRQHHSPPCLVADLYAHPDSLTHRHALPHHNRGFAHTEPYYRTPRRPWPRTRRPRPSCRLLATPTSNSSREGTLPTIDPHFPLRFLSRERLS